MISPNVQASEISGAALTQGIDTLQIYEDINTLPKNIQEKFLILPNSIGEYNIDDVRLEQTSELTTLTYIYKDDRNNELLIEEDAGLDENLMKTIIGHYVGVERCGDIDIYIGEHIEESNTISYMFIYKDVYIKILASSDFSKNEIFELIEKAAGE
jgi:ferredoxin-fold anticodon binding domain-containing protein